MPFRFTGPTMQEVLVLYYSHRGSVRALAELIARGIDAVPASAPGCAPYRGIHRLRKHRAGHSDHGAPYAEAPISKNASGSPSAADALRQHGGADEVFLDGTAGLGSRRPAGKPACVFTSSASQHGGQEARCCR